MGHLLMLDIQLVKLTCVVRFNYNADVFDTIMKSFRFKHTFVFANVNGGKTYFLSLVVISMNKVSCIDFNPNTFWGLTEC